MARSACATAPTRRRFRYGSRHDEPALRAAEFHGHGVIANRRRHRQSKMFGVLARDPGSRPPDALPLLVTSATCGSTTCASPTSPTGRSQGLNFEVPAGKTVAIVVPRARESRRSRGCCFGSYVTSGKILIDGQDIGIHAGSLRASIGMVPQTPCVQRHHPLQTSATAAGRQRREVEAAAQLARIDSFIRTSPKGYETQSASAAKTVRRREARVAIARTVLKGPPILVLDERPRRSTAIPSTKSRRRWSASRATAPRW